jgi:hypothetical protein
VVYPINLEYDAHVTKNDPHEIIMVDIHYVWVSGRLNLDSLLRDTDWEDSAIIVGYVLILILILIILILILIIIIIIIIIINIIIIIVKLSFDFYFI